jgi:hypothetical protein
MIIKIRKRSPCKDREELMVVIRTRGTGIWTIIFASEEHSGIWGS